MKRRRNPGRRWTLSAIKAANKRAGKHFFDRDTLKFFGDSMSNFGVRREGGSMIVYRKRSTHKGATAGTQWKFDPSTGELRYNRIGSNPRKRRNGRKATYRRVKANRRRR